MSKAGSDAGLVPAGEGGQRPNEHDLLTGFPPIAKANAHTLILGSMPGVASLEATQYYAHPRNAFWTIIASVTGVSAEHSYVERTQALADAGFALWDVVHQCVRPGSLDSNIRNEKLAPNAFAEFLEEHSDIRRVVFNGQKSESLFRKLVLPGLAAELELIRLPSTSPAHASLGLAEKKARWLEVLESSPIAG